MRKTLVLALALCLLTTILSAANDEDIKANKRVEFGYGPPPAPQGVGCYKVRVNGPDIELEL